LRARLTVDAVFKFRQARADALSDLGTKFGYFCAQCRDGAVRLRFNQCAFTLPRSTFAVEHLGQRLAPYVKQKVVVARFWRRC
jgi:hypothetical protein